MNDKLTDKQRTNRERSNANLKPFKPGESGNPAGRPKDPGITAIQEKMLDELCPLDEKKGRTWRQYLAERGLIHSSDVNSALENLKNRLEGKVADKIEGTDIPVTIILKRAEDRDG